MVLKSVLFGAGEHKHAQTNNIIGFVPEVAVKKHLINLYACNVHETALFLNEI